MLKEIAVTDIIEIIDGLRARERANCERHIDFNPTHKEERERQAYIYNLALNDVVFELSRRI